MGIAIGQMYMSKSSFEDTTINEWIHIHSAWIKRETDLMQERWEISRWSTACIVNTQYTKNIKLNDLIKFPWDNINQKNEEITMEERLERCKKILEWERI